MVGEPLENIQTWEHIKSNVKGEEKQIEETVFTIYNHTLQSLYSRLCILYAIFR